MKNDPRWIPTYLLMKSRAKEECSGACGEMVSPDDIKRLAVMKTMAYLQRTES